MAKWFTIGMVVMLVSVLVFAACAPTKQKAPRVYLNKTTEVKDLGKDDVLAMMDQHQINSSFVAIRGLRLGDVDETVIARLGRPVSYESFEEGSLNLRYENKVTNETQLIIHLENGTVRRMVVDPGFDGLVGRSRMNYSKADATRSFGKPDRVYDTKFYHIYEYHNLGLEIYFKAGNMGGYGFVPPS